MPVSTKTPPKTRPGISWQSVRALAKRRSVQITAAAFVVAFLLSLGVFAWFYSKYAGIVDERIRRPIFNTPAQIYAAGELLHPGDASTPAEIIADLRLAGYTTVTAESSTSVGTYGQSGSTLSITPGTTAFHAGQSATVHFADGRIDSITDARGQSLPSYELEPRLITGLFDAKARMKRRLLSYYEIPPLLTKAIVSVEDRRFFEHGGINYVRLVEGVLTPIFHHRRMQGGSTLTMQMARAFFLSNERSVRRKLAEIMIALVLEHRFTKEQILEIYVNQVDLGQHGSFDIRGFGQAAQVYFGKDIQRLNLPETALLAGLANGPSYFSPFHHPGRAVARRNIVLTAMYENHAIDAAMLAAAKAAPLKLAAPEVEAQDAPYYVDLVRDRLLERYEESDLDNSGMRVYTSLDQELQKAATQAVATGMQQVDEAIRRQRTRKIREGKGRNAIVRTEVASGPMPQVALIALDPHTGEVLALVGGRDYAASQLNHAMAKRPTGSIFKPFVYAAAINTALTGDPAKAITQTTMVDANEGTFDFNGKPYSPRNFEKDITGDVTARFALAHSINTATIRLAQMVGYDKVVQLAEAAGIQSLLATPAMAIGAYDAAPLDMAGAYTVFANGGAHLAPEFIRSIRGQHGETVEEEAPKAAGVLDPRAAFVVTDMLENVINAGTAEGVRARFNAPAAGKTGTSHDAWFAGYTSNLLCIVWVGNDDYTDIKLQGAHAAAPIWTDFMVRAQKLPRYADMQPFTPPQGVIAAQLDKATNLPADETCPDDYTAYFIDGTVPAATCGHPEGPSRNFLEKMFGIGKNRSLVLPPIDSSTPLTPNPSTGAPNPSGTVPEVTPPPSPPKEKKRGFWHRLFGGGKKDQQKNTDTGTGPQ